MIYKQLLAGTDGGDVLDVGCGSGQFTRILADSLGSFRTLTGVDVDEEVLIEARRTFKGAAFAFQKASSMDLPFGDGSFDLAVISKSLHHVEVPEIALGEMYRVLRSGGYLLINEMHRGVLSDEQESYLIYHHLRAEIDDALGISHNHTFKRDDLISLASGLGLKDLQIHEFIPDTGHLTAEEYFLEYSAKLEGWLEELMDHSRKEEFAGRIQQVRRRIRQFGIARPPQMVFFGMK